MTVEEVLQDIGGKLSHMGDICNQWGKYRVVSHEWTQASPEYINRQVSLQVGEYWYLNYQYGIGTKNWGTLWLGHDYDPIELPEDLLPLVEIRDLITAKYNGMMRQHVIKQGEYNKKKNNNRRRMGEFLSTVIERDHDGQI